MVFFAHESIFAFHQGNQARQCSIQVAQVCIVFLRQLRVNQRPLPWCKSVQATGFLCRVSCSVFLPSQQQHLLSHSSKNKRVDDLHRKLHVFLLSHTFSPSSSALHESWPKSCLMVFSHWISQFLTSPRASFSGINRYYRIQYCRQLGNGGVNKLHRKWLRQILFNLFNVTHVFDGYLLVV